MKYYIAWSETHLVHVCIREDGLIERTSTSERFSIPRSIEKEESQIVDLRGTDHRQNEEFVALLIARQLEGWSTWGL